MSYKPLFIFFFCSVPFQRTKPWPALSLVLCFLAWQKSYSFFRPNSSASIVAKHCLCAGAQLIAFSSMVSQRFIHTATTACVTFYDTVFYATLCYLIVSFWGLGTMSCLVVVFSTPGTLSAHSRWPSLNGNDLVMGLRLLVWNPGNHLVVEWPQTNYLTSLSQLSLLTMRTWLIHRIAIGMKWNILSIQHLVGLQ